MMTITWASSDTVQLPEGGDSSTMEFGRLDLDIVEQDSYDVAASITSHAVESGISITDHMRPEQDRATVTALVSGRQSTLTLGIDGVMAGSIDLGDGATATGIVVPEGLDRIGDVHTTLRQLCRDGTEVDVEGLRRPIQGWLIERVSSPRTVEDSGLLVAEITFVEVRYADTEEVDAPSPRVERGRARRDTGREQVTPVADEDVEADPADRRSSLARLADGVAGT